MYSFNSLYDTLEMMVVALWLLIMIGSERTLNISFFTLHGIFFYLKIMMKKVIVFLWEEDSGFFRTISFRVLLANTHDGLH